MINVKLVSIVTPSALISSVDILTLNEHYSAKALSLLDIIRRVDQQISSYHDSTM